MQQIFSLYIFCQSFSVIRQLK